MIRVKRVYNEPERQDGMRILVDRLWPRWLKKEAARLDDWMKDVAPSDALRRWFGHDPKRWDEFQRRYLAELDEKPERWRTLLERSRVEPITLLYAASDPDYNNAVALKRYLERRAKRRRPTTRSGEKAVANPSMRAESSHRRSRHRAPFRTRIHRRIRPKTPRGVRPSAVSGPPNPHTLPAKSPRRSTELSSTLGVHPS